MWKGVITSGLVVILVRLYVATESDAVAFRELPPQAYGADSPQALVRDGGSAYSGLARATRCL